MYKILIADDEEIIRMGLKQVLTWEELGFTVVGAVSNGFEALEFIERNTIDVLLTDVRMPRMSGLQLAQQVSQRAPHIKIVILSGYNDFHYAQEAINYSVFSYILKPSKEQDIINVFSRLKELLDDEQVQYEKLQQNNDIILENTIIDMIIGTLSYHSEHDGLLLQLCPQSEEYYKGILIIEMTDEMLEDCCQDATAFIRKCSEKITSSVKKLSSKEHTCIPFSISIGEINILICSKEEAGVEHAAQFIFDCVQKDMSEYKYLSITGGLGDIFTDIYDSRNSYYSAKEVLGHKIYKGKNKLLLRSDISFNGDRLQELPLEKLAVKIVKAVTCANYEEGRQVIGFIFNEMKKMKVTNIEWVYSSLNRLLFLTEAEFAALGLNARRIFGCSDHILQKLKKAATLDDMRYYMEELISRAIANFQESEKDSVSKMIKVAIEKITSSYAEEISLESVAQYLNISPTYLSRLFKKELNVNFKEYLIGVRIYRAKELLKDIRFKVYEVAEQVGYLDQRYFSEIFRNKTGLTPLEYREKVRERDEKQKRI